MDKKSKLNELGRKIERQRIAADDLHVRARKQYVKLRELQLEWLEAEIGLKVGCRIITAQGTEYEVAHIGSFDVTRKGDDYAIRWRPQLDGYKIKKDGEPSKKKQFIAASNWKVKGKA